MTTDFQNTLYTQDNLFVLYGLNSDLVDLIYLDPPFNSKRMYSAPVGSKAAGSSFKDMWEWKDINEAYLEKLTEKYPTLVRFISSIGNMHSKEMMAYITYMAQRVIELHRVLKDTGSFYLHCDPTASHYLKGLLDIIFGKNNFRNEIIWHYEKWTAPSKIQYQKNHDVILHYSKSQNVKFNIQFHLTDNLEEKYAKGYSTGGGAGSNGLIIYDKNSLKAKQLAESGKYIVRYEEPKGKPLSDVWQIPIINPMSKERTGYPTQKPLALLKRIIEASSKVGDIVLDPFCGCATTCVSAQMLNRKWIGIDIAEKSASILLERLSEAGNFLPNDKFVHRLDIPKRTDVKEESDKNPNVKKQLFKEQEGKCNGCHMDFPEKIMEVDHIVPKAKGGGDYYENYQLLCSACNRVKGARPMDYLRMKIKAIEEKLKLQFTFGE